jgi:hypothetical protein
MHLWRFVSVVLLAGLLVGCRPVSVEREAWYRAPPTDGDLYWTWPKLDQAHLHEVMEERQEEAQARLKEAALIELTAEQAAGYIGHPLPAVPGTLPYLVRSLYRNPGMGQFVVYTSGEQLVVQHGSLGSGRAPPGRRALVLQLEYQPSEVYVDVKTAK